MIRKLVINVYHKFSAFNRWLVFIAGIMTLTMSLMIFYAVLMRYLFSSPPHWTTETATFMLLFICFIPAGLVLQMDQHVKVDFVLIRLKPKTVRRIKIINSILATAYFSVLFWQSCVLVYRAFKRDWVSWELNIPLCYPYLLIPLGCGLVIIAGLFSLLEQFVLTEEPRE